jgi:signal peptide peptidase SppA
MRVIDILTSPWAIMPDKLVEIRAIYETHLRGEKIDIKALEAKLGAPLNNEARGYDVMDGVAVLPIVGVIGKRMNLFSQISGGTSMQLIAQDLARAIEDPSVHSVVLLIDSPGGTVDGTQELAVQVRAAAERKPVVTLADGAMGSAAYWIGSAASEVLISSDTTLVGSIGVVATHKDVSGAEQQAGVKTTEIAAGKYKRVASQYAALSDEGRQTLQDQVDYLYGIFVDSVAAHRGVTVDKVLSDMADGRVFIGQQAVKAGLVDGASTLSALVADLAAGRRGKKPTAGAGAAPQATNQPKGTDEMITKESLEKDYPAIAEALRAEGFTAGATAERERILAVEAKAIPGHEKLVAELKADGKTTGDQAASRILEAEKAAREAAARAHVGDRPVALPAGAAPKDEGEGKDKPLDSAKLAAEAKRLVAIAAKDGLELSASEAVKQAAAKLRAEAA